MSWILLTNDDGVDSPALLPFARALGRLGAVRVVVPDRERSWVGKAITRHERLHVRRISRDGQDVWTCSGYPADAVQIGLHGLFEEPPALLVSGINLGFNHGAAFLMSSGTVGAAVEGWIGGIPSVAVSTGTLVDWPSWRRAVEEPSAIPGWERTAVVAAAVTSSIVESGVLAEADVVSVNMPFDPAPETRRRVTTLARVGYDRLFISPEPGVFVHEFGGGIRTFASLAGSDIESAQSGEISINPLRLPYTESVDPEIVRRLEAT